MPNNRDFVSQICNFNLENSAVLLLLNMLFSFRGHTQPSYNPISCPIRCLLRSTEVSGDISLWYSLWLLAVKATPPWGTEEENTEKKGRRERDTGALMRKRLFDSTSARHLWWFHTPGSDTRSKWRVIFRQWGIPQGNSSNVGRKSYANGLKLMLN